MEIRPVQPQDDRAAISRIYEESWKHAYRGIVPQAYLDRIPTGGWCNSIDTPDRHSLVLLDDVQIVGTASYSASRWHDWSGYGEIISIYILPDYCGKGHGKQLLSTAVDHLAKLGFHDILLWVLEGNDTARRFYERFGFQPSGAYLDDEIGGKPLREIQYTYHI